MPLPITDAQTYHLTLGPSWLYHDEQPGDRWSGKSTLGWVRDPLYAWVGGSQQPVIHDLAHLDGMVAYRWGSWTASADTSLRAVWNGQVGFGDPRGGLSFTSPHTTASARWEVPLATIDNPLRNPGSVFELSASHGASRWRVSAGASVHAAATPEWPSLTTVSLGLQPIKGWTVESKTDYLWSGILRSEVASTAHRRFAGFDGSIGLVVGLTPTISTPRWRVLLTTAWFDPPPAAVVETLPVPELPPPPTIEQAPPLAAEPVEPVVPEDPTPPAASEPSPPDAPAPPLDRKYGSVLDAAAGYFLAHPSVRFIVESNGSRRQAELVVEELQKRGILKERVVRIDTVTRSGAVVFEFIVVDGQSSGSE